MFIGKCFVDISMGVYTQREKEIEERELIGMIGDMM